MKKMVLILVLILSTSLFASNKKVSGYTKSNGTHVNAYNRSGANKSKTDNYSAKGNTNPYTGKKGTKK